MSSEKQSASSASSGGGGDEGLRSGAVEVAATLSSKSDNSIEEDVDEGEEENDKAVESLSFFDKIGGVFSKLKPAPMIRRRPTWTRVFGTAIKVLRSLAKTIPRDITAIRMLTDHSIPKWILPSSYKVDLFKSHTPPGELYYPKIDDTQEPKDGGDKVSKKIISLNILHRPLDDNSRIILYFHGGAFCCCNSTTHRGLLHQICGLTGSVIMAVDYRRPPESPYPAPVEDCLEAYKWLLERGIDSSRIVFGGDSAGGGLVVAVMLAAAAAGLPPPKAGILLSPWVDLSEVSNSSWEKFKNVDYLPPDLALLFAESYKGKSSTWEEVSPSLSTNLKALSPCLVLYGECECLSEQIEEFCKKCISAGVSIDKIIAADMVHVYPLFAFTGMPACDEAFEHINRFISKHLPLP